MSAHKAMAIYSPFQLTERLPKQIASPATPQTRIVVGSFNPIDLAER